MRSRWGGVVAVLVALVLGGAAVLVTRAARDDSADASHPSAGTPTASSTEQVAYAACPSQDLSDRPFRVGAETGPIAGPAPRDGRVCAYDRGQLVGSQVLSADQAVGLAAAVSGGVDGVGPEGLGCPRDAFDYIDGPLEPHFTAHLTYAVDAPTDLWVYGNVCTPAGVVNSVGRFLRLGPRLGPMLGRLVRTPTPFPVTDPSLSPGPVPSGPMTDAECPGGINSGVPDWFGGEPVRRAPDRRAIEMSRQLRAQFPDVLIRQAGFTATTQELSLIRADSTRNGRFQFERVGPGRWSLREWQSCSPRGG